MRQIPKTYDTTRHMKHMLDTLQTKVMESSINLLQRVEKRFVVAVETGSEHWNKPCLSNKNINYAQAAALMCVCLGKISNGISFCTFNGRNLLALPIYPSKWRGEAVPPGALPPRCHRLVSDSSYTHVIQVIKNTTCGPIIYSTVPEVCMACKHEFDVFVNISYCNSFNSLSQINKGYECVMKSFRKYKAELRMPTTKWVKF